MQEEVPYPDQPLQVNIITMIFYKIGRLPMTNPPFEKAFHNDVHGYLESFKLINSPK